MSSGHGHAVSGGARHKKRLQIVLAVTGAYLVAEVVGGLVTGSLALLADAGHMLTDVGGLVLALTGIVLAERKATPERTYGLYRFEILAALTNAVVLLGVSGYVLVEAIGRLRHPPEVQSGVMLGVGAAGLVVNLVGVKLLRDGSDESLNVKGAYFEVLSDLLTSVAVVVAGLIMMFTQWYLVDPILSAGIGLFIVPRTWSLLKEAVHVLLEGTPSDVNLPAVREAIETTAGVAGAHDLHVWSLTSGVNALSVHVVLAGGADHTAVRCAVRAKLKDGFPLHHLTIQAEPPGEEEGEVHL